MKGIKESASDSFEGNRNTMKQYIGGEYVDFIAYLGSIIDCSINIEKFQKEDNKDLMIFYLKVKAVLLVEFERHYINNYQKYTKK